MRYDKETRAKLDARTPLQKKWHWHELNTFKEWKELGYRTKKGSKGVFIQGGFRFTREQVTPIPTKADKERAWANYKAQHSSGCFYDHDEMNDYSCGAPY